MNKEIKTNHISLTSVEEENFYTNNINETSQKSPLISYKVNKYSRFYHPISPKNTFPLEFHLLPVEKSENASENMHESATISSNESDNEPLIFHEFKKFIIKDGSLSPSPEIRKKKVLKEAETKSKNMKYTKSFCFGLIKVNALKELKKWWISSPDFNVICTTYDSQKHIKLDKESEFNKITKRFKKFPSCIDLSINLETFAEMGEKYSIAIRNILSFKKMDKVKDIRFVSFPGEKNLWHGPAFLFNAVMGFNKFNDTEEGNHRLEIWHRFRSYFDRGCFQKELIEILMAINNYFKEEKVQILHLILASNLRINDKIINHINEILSSFLQNLIEFKLFISSNQITDKGIQEICKNINNICPVKLKAFHLFLDYRSNHISEYSVINVCRTLLQLAENNVIEYLSLGFISINLRDSDLIIIAEALKMISKTLRSLVLIIVGHINDEGLMKLLDKVLEGPYLKRICLGFMGPLLGNYDFLRFLCNKIAYKREIGCLNVFNLYYNNKKGGKNEEMENLFKKKIQTDGKVDMETYIFC